MSDPGHESFVKEEAISRTGGLIALNSRLFLEFKLFFMLLPVSIGAILLSSIAPSFYRWYSGNLSTGAGSAILPYIGVDVAFSIYGLALITFLAVLFRISAWASFELSGMWSSQGLHSKMVRGLSRTRTTYFDENPSARLINRLVRDYDEVRSTAIIFVGDFFNASVEIAGTVVVASLASSWTAALAVPLLGAFAYVQSQRSAMLEHSRSLSAVAVSQVLGRKTDLIEGREIFLLYKKADLLLERMARSFRVYVQASALSLLIEVWTSFWIRVSAELFSLGVLVFTVFALEQKQLNPALAGVIISALFGITGSISWLDIATSLISRSAPHVRRVFELVDLPQEASEEGRGEPVSGQSFAASGDIEFVNYTMSYRSDTPVILSQLNLRLPAGSKTALVGRTGSGKTSLTQALLRMVYVRGGDIRWGSSSIFEVDVRELRRQFGVVPQSPYLFAGTIASNLDRMQTLPVEKLRDAMRVVGLEYPLEHVVSEGGHNLSVGERQLVCLARVIAADKRVILMDEPTSGLDPQTDARVSRLLRTALKDKTVLTIAHRRESLADYDRVVEMELGRVKT